MMCTRYIIRDMTVKREEPENVKLSNKASDIRDQKVLLQCKQKANTDFWMKETQEHFCECPRAH